MSQITIQTAEKSWTEILRKALEGEETIIEKDGKPVAKVSPFKIEEDWFGMDEGKGWIADDFDETPEEFSEIITPKVLRTVKRLRAWCSAAENQTLYEICRSLDNKLFQLVETIVKFSPFAKIFC